MHDQRDDLAATLDAAAREHEQARVQGETGLREFTEDAVARRFARHVADALAYDHAAEKWFIWRDAVWVEDTTGEAIERIRLFVEAQRNRAIQAKDLAAMGRVKFILAVERIIRSDPVLAVSATTWNSNPWLLGTPDGTVDLRTGALHPADPTDYISRSTSVSPAQEAACPAWLAFLEQAAGADQSLIDFLQRWFGYCLTGLTREHALLFLYGPGGKGKGVLLQTISGILGTYAATAAMDTFAASHADRHPTDLAMLHGARMVITTETEEGHAWAEARIKALTGGDAIAARFMRRDFFTFTPAFKLTISGNHKPELRNVDDAARRRFNVAPFLQKPPHPDRELVEKLKPEWPGILRWLIAGCVAWQQDGLVRPDAVTAATADYFAEQDILAQWVDECCDTGVRIGDTRANLFASWRSFAALQGEEPRNAKWFCTMLERLNFKRDKDCELFRGRGYRGIRVRPISIGSHWQDRD